MKVTRTLTQPPTSNNASSDAKPTRSSPASDLTYNLDEVTLKSRQIRQIGRDEELFDNGNTPLHLAASSSIQETVQLLLASLGNDPTQANTYGNTPLHLAACWGHEKSAQYLLTANSSNLNTPNNEGFTPLHLAAFWGHIEVVEVLLRMPRIYLSPRSHTGHTPLDLAASKGLTYRLAVTLGQNYNWRENGNCAGRHAYPLQTAKLTQLLLQHRNADGNPSELGVSSWSEWLYQHPKLNRAMLILALIETKRLGRGQIQTLANQAIKQGDYALWSDYQVSQGIAASPQDTGYWKTLEAETKKMPDGALWLKPALQFFIDYIYTGNAGTLRKQLQTYHTTVSKENSFGRGTLHVINHLKSFLEAAGDIKMAGELKAVWATCREMY